jgi:hypothetical protein
MDTQDAKVKHVATQLNKTASILKSAAMRGNAMCIAEDIKGIRKLLSVTLTRVERLRPVSFIRSNSFSK